tara:strand:+ start:625 stop:996 length:372 start_codon:yes stop_codon:yes gene_type:complete
MELNQNEEQAIKGALLSTIHHMAKLVSQGSLVSASDFKEMMEKTQKDDIFLVAITEVKYLYQGYYGPIIEVHCSFKKHKYRASFYMAEPHGKFSDRSLIPHNIKVEKFLRWDEYMEENIWEKF